MIVGEEQDEFVAENKLQERRFKELHEDHTKKDRYTSRTTLGTDQAEDFTEFDQYNQQLVE